MRRPLALLVLAACSRAEPDPAPPARTSASNVASREGAELVGTRPPEWQADAWTTPAPLTLAGLRGKVVLARWWTAGCPFCEASAPALRDMDRRFGPRGLAVIGFYHHKGDGPLDLAVVRETASRYGFTFPLAVDTDWRTLDRWWAPRDNRRTFTSVSFLLDRRGVIRLVHPGGQYVRGDGVLEEIERTVEALLAEPAG
jgi:peroxiredoxin